MMSKGEKPKIESDPIAESACILQDYINAAALTELLGGPNKKEMLAALLAEKQEDDENTRVAKAVVRGVYLGQDDRGNKKDDDRAPRDEHNHTVTHARDLDKLDMHKQAHKYAWGVVKPFVIGLCVAAASLVFVIVAILLRME